MYPSRSRGNMDKWASVKFKKYLQDYSVTQPVCWSLTPVPKFVLEDRLAMYFQAIDHATAANDSQRRQLLEKDIQMLMDLMERANLGKVVTSDEVPPPLHIHPQTGHSVANLLDELSSRLADYHKALYFADIEIVGNPLTCDEVLTSQKSMARTQQIQNLQRGIQVIQKLQGQAAAGFPVQPEEIPPPVSIPSDDEFVVNPVAVITEQLSVYQQALEVAREEGDMQKVATFQASIMILDFLLKRAEARIPIYKKDLPENITLSKKLRKETEMYKSTVETLTKMSGLSARASKLAMTWGNTELADKLQNNAKMLMQALHDYELGKPPDLSACPYSLADIQRLADDAGFLANQHRQDAEVVKMRLNQYKLAALKAKQGGQRDLAIQHMKVVKTLQQLLQTLEKGEVIDISQLPPPPMGQPLTTEELSKTETYTSAAQEFQAESVIEVDGKSLAEELSSFLDEPGEIEGSSPLVGKLNIQNTPSHQPAINGNSKQECLVKPLSSSGQLNCIQTPHRVPESLQTSQIAPDIPVSLSVHQQHVSNGVNSHHGNMPHTGQTKHHVQDIENNTRHDVGQMTEERNGRTGVSCIEILKYEKSLLQLEGTPEAVLRSENLGQQMEEEKQKLKIGGYDAWLLYLGKVEKDVLQINCELKTLRESRQEDKLAIVVIKKELAERELAVMRKRLPELRS